MADKHALRSKTAIQNIPQNGHRSPVSQEKGYKIQGKQSTCRLFVPRFLDHISKLGQAPLQLQNLQEWSRRTGGSPGFETTFSLPPRGVANRCVAV